MTILLLALACSTPEPREVAGAEAALPEGAAATLELAVPTRPTLPLPAPLLSARRGAHSCFVLPAGEVRCWGNIQSRRNQGQMMPPAGDFVAVATAHQHSCGLRPDGELECWGTTIDSDERFVRLAAGADTTCALTEAGALRCWGAADPVDLPAQGPYVALDVGLDGGVCVLDTTGQAHCTGRFGAALGAFTTISVGYELACGLRSTGAASCWGRNKDGQTRVPELVFAEVQAATGSACGVAAGALHCWGEPDLDAAPWPSGVVAVRPGDDKPMLLLDGGRIVRIDRGDTVELHPKPTGDIVDELYTPDGAVPHPDWHTVDPGQGFTVRMEGKPTESNRGPWDVWRWQHPEQGYAMSVSVQPAPPGDDATLHHFLDQDLRAWLPTAQLQKDRIVPFDGEGPGRGLHEFLFRDDAATSTIHVRALAYDSRLYAWSFERVDSAHGAAAYDRFFRSFETN